MTRLAIKIGIVMAVGAFICWNLASIHQAAVRACPTMDAHCQIEQEAPQ